MTITSYIQRDDDANILYSWGRYEDAIRIMKDALAINDLEVYTMFVLGFMSYLFLCY
jgi:hypothetical protein